METGARRLRPVLFDARAILGRRETGVFAKFDAETVELFAEEVDD